MTPTPEKLAEAVERLTRAAGWSDRCGNPLDNVFIIRADLETLLTALAAKDAALRPFAEAGQHIHGIDSAVVFVWTPGKMITAGNFRAAATALGDPT